MRFIPVLSILALVVGCGGGSNYPVSGIKIDSTPPLVTGTTPQNASTGVAVNKVVNILFNELIDPSSVNDASVTVIGPDNNSVEGLLFVTSATVVFVPDAVLSGNKVYTVKVGGIRDLAGNTMNGMATSAFTTGTNLSDPPAVISTIPGSNTQDVAINSSIIATFNKPLNCATVKDFRVNTSSGEVSGTIRCNDNTITFTPSAQLAYGTTFTAIIKGVADSGNDYMMSNAYNWSFKTGFIPDTTRPEIISTTPTASATGVSISSGVTVKFSEEIDCSSVTSGVFTLTNSGGSVVGTVSCNNDTALLTPSSSLVPNTVYAAAVGGGTGGVKDTSGNSLLNNYTWNFTTAIPSYITSISGGLFHTIALKGNTVYTWGDNTYGQLGKAGGGSNVPVAVTSFSGVIAVSAGDYHSVALKADGTVWAWGANSYGQLGDGTTSNKTVPVQIQSLSNIVEIAAGGNFTLARKTDGTVWAWGDNTFGQIGNGASGYGNIVTQPIQVIGLTRAVSVSAGGSHSLAIKDDGTVWAWGDNQYGQIGNGSSGPSNVVTIPVQILNFNGVMKVSGGRWSHSIALKSDGTVWTWGLNNYGQLGNGSNTDSALPIQVTGLTNVTNIAGGGTHSFAVNNGTVWSWGYNAYGQLGTGSTINSTVPVQTVTASGAFTASVIAAGYNFSMGIMEDGTVWTWGLNQNGQLGTGNYLSYANPTRMPGF